MPQPTVLDQTTLFSTIALTKSVTIWNPPASGLKDLFFRQSFVSPTKFVQWDSRKESKLLADFVSPNAQAKPVNKSSFKTNVVEPPYISMKANITSIDLLTRGFGMTIYDASNNNVQKAVELLNFELKKLQNRCVRREEWMCATSLTTGKLALDGDYTGVEYDWGMPAGHIASASLDWDNTSSDPIQELGDWAEMITDVSGFNVDTVIMGTAASYAFLNNTKVQALMDKLKLRIGEINVRNVAKGLYFIGTLAIPNATLDLYSYNEKYVDDSGTEHRYLDTKKIIMGSTSAGEENMMGYGAIQNVEYAEIMPTRWYTSSWIEKDPSVRFLKMESAPMSILRIPEAFGCFTVLS